MIQIMTVKVDLPRKRSRGKANLSCRSMEKVAAIRYRRNN